MFIWREIHWVEAVVQEAEAAAAPLAEAGEAADEAVVVPLAGAADEAAVLEEDFLPAAEVHQEAEAVVPLAEQAAAECSAEAGNPRVRGLVQVFS